MQRISQGFTLILFYPHQPSPDSNTQLRGNLMHHTPLGFERKQEHLEENHAVIVRMYKLCADCTRSQDRTLELWSSSSTGCASASDVAHSALPSPQIAAQLVLLPLAWGIELWSQLLAWDPISRGVSITAMESTYPTCRLSSSNQIAICGILSCSANKASLFLPSSLQTVHGVKDHCSHQLAQWIQGWLIRPILTCSFGHGLGREGGCIWVLWKEDHTYYHLHQAFLSPGCTESR